MTTEKLTLYIYSRYGSFVLEIKNDTEIAFIRYLELISIFWAVDIENRKITLTPIQEMTVAIRSKYNEFVNVYKSSTPILNRLKATLDKIPEGGYFFTSNKSGYTTSQILFIGNLIDSHNNSLTEEEIAAKFSELTEQMDSSFGELLKNYEVKTFDSTQNIKIGESDRSKRICRFCGNGMNTDVKVKFTLKAHAFSEALGNKSIILNEECDTCNGKFGSYIEDDFIKYLDIYRAFYKVKGKNGTPTLKFKNGVIQEVDGLTTVMSQDIEHNEENGNFTALLKSSSKLANVNIYKTLCKYVISVIDGNELIHLTRTIKWIASNEETQDLLPKVAVGISNEMYVDVPVLGLYIRKDNNTEHPHIVAEFKFKALIFVFIVPFSARDQNNFASDESYKKFWTLFKHYSSLKTWSFNSFSSCKKEEFQFRINMINQKP